MARTWKYEATVIRVVDGDTAVVDIDQGMNHWSRGQYVRFAGIDAPERSTDEGQTAKDFTSALLPPGTQIWLVTTEYHEFEKYGRVLAYLYLTEPYSNPATDLLTGSVNEDLLVSGNAVPY